MAIIVTKRSRCYMEPGGGFWEYQTIVQVAGLPHFQAEDLTRKMDMFDEYKCLCNCEHCVSYEEKLNVFADQLKGEPMTQGLVQVFNVLISDWHYEIKSTSVAQNNDGSTTTTWIMSK